jgi:hypothetical protein
MTATAASPHRSPPGSAGAAAGRREVLAFRVAMGLIALSVADDAFVASPVRPRRSTCSAASLRSR